MARESRRQQIIDTARELFSTRGYHATSIRDIAEAVGMLSGSLYAHISTKEDVLFEIVDEAAEQFLAAAADAAGLPGGPEERLVRYMENHMQVVARYRHASTVFFHEWRWLDPERRRIIQEKRDRYEAALAAIIQEGIDAGEFAPTDARLARLLILSALNWAYVWYDPAGPLRPEEVARRFASIILEGVRAHDRERAPGGVRSAH